MAAHNALPYALRFALLLCIKVCLAHTRSGVLQSFFYKTAYGCRLELLKCRKYILICYRIFADKRMVVMSACVCVLCRSVPSGRVGSGRDHVYKNNEQFREAVVAQEREDVTALEQRLLRRLEKHTRSHIGVSQVRRRLEVYGHRRLRTFCTYGSFFATGLLLSATIGSRFGLFSQLHCKPFCPASFVSRACRVLHYRT